MLNRNETIAAIATAPGPAGVAVVRVSGPAAFAVAGRLTRGRFAPPDGLQPQAQACKLFGEEKDSRRPTADDGGSFSPQVSLAPQAPLDFPHPPELSKPPKPPKPPPLDEAVVLSFRAPRSYTGEDVVEFQCHGGAVTPRRVLEACFAAGARLARRGEFTERAFLNGKLDYNQAESVLDLIQAKTDRAADAALDGLRGRRARANRALYEQALALSSELEHALDVDEGELPEGFFASVSASLAALAAALDAAAARLRERKILRDGALVVLAGPPNAGKSSLLNALLGESRAIVSDVPGTTRDSVEAWLDLDGWPVRLVDTAGLRETCDAIESAGVARAERLIKEADVVVLLGEVGVAREEEAKEAEETKETRETKETPALLVIHPKCDLSRSPSLLNVSAKTGEGLNDLRRAIADALAQRTAETAAEESSDAPDAQALSVICAARARLTPFAAASATADGAAAEGAAAPVAAPDALAAAPLDLVLAGNAVRSVAESLGALVGATYSADLLGRLFSRFCVGK